MISKASILFVKPDDEPCIDVQEPKEKILNTEFKTYFSRIIFSIISAHVERVFDDKNIGELPESLLFIHNVRSCREESLLNEWVRDDCKNEIERELRSRIVSLNGTRRKEKIELISEDTPGEDRRDWKAKLEPFFNGRVNFAIVHNVGELAVADMDDAFGINEPEASICSYYKASSKCNLGVVSVTSYHDCEIILRTINNPQHNLENFVIVRSKVDDCYSETVDYKHKQGELSSSSLTFITSEDTGIPSPNSFGFFSPVENKYIIKKNKNDKILEKTLKRWAHAFIFKPSCYFSYAEKDSFDDFMEKIDHYSNIFYPFVSFQRDKDAGNSFINIEKYSDNLYKGDVVFLLITRNFLLSFYCMRELTRVMKNKRLIYSVDEEFTQKDFDNIASFGLFPLIGKDAKELLYVNNNRLKDEWLRIKDENDGSYPVEDVEEIIYNIDELRVTLSKVYSFNTLEDFMENRFPDLIFLIKEAFVGQRQGNFYHNYTLTRFKQDYEKIINYKGTNSF